jgi:TetR/AcrR family transcriptional regulator, transcriptional repressor of bet genes
MPKQVDHDERRAALAAAVWRLVVEEGLEGVSMRRVAAAAGVSLGQVQHYFAGKDDLLMVAFELVSAQFTRRAAAAPPALTPREQVRALLTQMLPLDEERRVEAHVGTAFLARATVSPTFAEVMRDGARWATEFLAERITEAQRLGEVAAGRNPRHEAAILLAVVDGLTANTLVGFHTPATAEATLDALLADLFGSAS